MSGCLYLLILFFVAGASGSAMAAEDPYASQREAMVQQHIVDRGIHDPAVLAAMNRVPRHMFVPEKIRYLSYEDHPLPIGDGQTISQPYIVALMTESLRLRGSEKVLEVGTGSGYQAAVLAEIVPEVFSIEIIPALAESAHSKLREAGYKNVHVRKGDGYRGWPEHAPFDAIIVTAAPDHVPQPLVDQLADGGRLVIPVADTYPQRLILLKKKDGKVTEELISGVMFVPMTGEAEGR